MRSLVVAVVLGTFLLDCATARAPTCASVLLLSDGQKTVGLAGFSTRCEGGRALEPLRTEQVAFATLSCDEHQRATGTGTLPDGGAVEFVFEQAPGGDARCLRGPGQLVWSDAQHQFRGPATVSPAD